MSLSRAFAPWQSCAAPVDDAAAGLVADSQQLRLLMSLHQRGLWARVQAVLQQLDRPLLCSSIRPLDVLSGALDDGAVLLDQYAPRGLDYVVDNGVRYGEGSSVVDMTVRTPLLSQPCAARRIKHGTCRAHHRRKSEEVLLLCRSTRRKCCEAVLAM